VRIRGDRLKWFADQAGLGVDELAGVVDRTGLEGERARRAVRNWMSGRDHPRCKAADLRKLADELGCEPRDLARFVSEVRFTRGSARKARLVTDLIKGKKYEQALHLLTFSTKRAAVNVRKALNAAMADAQAEDADPELLVVVESRVDDGPQIKRWRPKDRGRAHPILKRTSHITVGLEERL